MDIALIITSIIILILILMYNSLVNKKKQVENIFTSINIQLKKRYYLIPNLVVNVKEYMEHEKSVLKKVTSLRTQAIRHNLPQGKIINLDNKITSALTSLMIAVESYPELKVNENIIQLQASLNDAEKQIAALRRAYNQAVKDYNNTIEMIPINFLAKIMNYKRKDVFVIA